MQSPSTAWRPWPGAHAPGPPQHPLAGAREIEILADGPLQPEALLVAQRLRLAAQPPALGAKLANLPLRITALGPHAPPSPPARARVAEPPREREAEGQDERNPYERPHPPPPAGGRSPERSPRRLRVR